MRMNDGVYLRHVLIDIQQGLEIHGSLTLLDDVSLEVNNEYASSGTISS